MIAAISTGRGGSALTASEMKTAVSHRTWSAMDIGRARTCHAFLIIEGTGTITEGVDFSFEINGPCMIWFPEICTSQFRLHAGGRGALFSVKSEFMLRTLGSMSFGLQLRPLLEASLVLSSEKTESQIDELSMSFSALVRETHVQTGGSQEMISAHLTLIFIAIWRMSSATSARKLAHTMNLPTAQRFQHLLELHYHEGLKVDDYAEILGVTRAHLHDACLRTLDQTPLVVIHERLVGEAIQRLEHTTLPIEQIAYSLGFRDAGYFNRFFKRLTKETPGAYRARILAQSNSSDVTSFEAWP